MLAFLRELSPQLDGARSISSPRGALKIERARKQLEAYVAALREFGVRVEFLQALPNHANGVLVDAHAILLPEVAIIAPAGISSPQSELETIASHIAQYRAVERIRSGRLDGNDVLRIGNAIFVAETSQTNAEGISALREIVDQYGYEVRPIEIRECHQLKRACTFIPPDFVVVNRAWIDVQTLEDFRIINVDPDEPFGANTLTLCGTTLVSAAFRKTEARLRAAGIATRPIDISELQKAGAGLTSLSLILEPRTRTRVAPRSAVTSIKTPGAPAPLGYGTQAVVHGGFVYASGQLPINPATRRVVPGGIEAQTEQTLNNLAAVLSASGSSLARVLKMTLYLTDRKLLDRVDAVLARVMMGHRPARVVRPTRSLPDGCLLEIEVVAAVGGD